ncbi:non-ribosomal peptide synthetase [Streptomyces lavendofoliae]|uniref:non-ribosomal peptide synthetase n=1 Tax=Streptomyces lavendofoliae TaxID=67314 RepID=UPI00300F6A60
MSSTRTLPALFAETLARHADRPAVSDDVGTWTYRQLDARSRRLAASLIERGIRPEDHVGIRLPRGREAIAALLGVVRAGASAVPIDADYPLARRDLMVRDSGLRVLVGQAKEADTLPPGVELLAWDGAASKDARLNAPRDDPATTEATGDDGLPAHDEASLAALGGPYDDPEAAACVLYTSGSTGEPKGIVFTHGNIVALARSASLPKLGPDDKIGQISSISFDGITLEMWAALAAGAEVVVLPKIDALLPIDLRRELKRRRVTMMLVPAAVLNEVTRVDRDAFSPLKYLCSGGDVLLPKTCRELLAGAFKGTLYNLYGPSEITTAATACHVDSVADDTPAIPIGTALDGYETYVVDERLRPLPAGESGELLVGGVGVARGYLGRPDLTAERFLPNPFGAPGSRLYATGDRVRTNAGGQLEFLGRFDTQVKIRGHRVEPTEVEQAICRHPEVLQAAVLVDDTSGERSLAAFIVSASEDLTGPELRRYLADTVPRHMVPGSVLVIDALPTTSNGKRDRDALHALRAAEVRRRSGAAPPETRTERRLAALWERVLKVEDVSATDDFFELGGHSLLAFRVRSAIVKELGTPVESHVLFEHSTLRELAEVIDRTSSAKEAPGHD